MFLYTLIVAGCEVGHVLFVKLCWLPCFSVCRHSVVLRFICLICFLLFVGTNNFHYLRK